jgi:hypothetical protein
MGIRKKNNLSELELHLRMSLLMKVDLLSNYLGTKIFIAIIFIDTTPHLQKTIRDISVPLALKLTSTCLK